MKIFLYDFEITDPKLIAKLKSNVLGYFEQICDNHYICKGYKHPLLAHITNNFSRVRDPFSYHGAYSYNGEDKITLHSTYGRFDTYKKLTIFDMPFMVCTSMTDEDAVLSAETDKRFIETLIEALA